MTDAVQNILDIADGGVKYRTERLPKVKIRQQSPMPSLKLLSIIAVAFVLLFCVFSAIQLFGIKSKIYDLREKKEQLRQYEQTLEGITATRYARLGASTEYTFKD